MVKSILGRKVGMTQVFYPTGEAVPVTIIEAGPCVITQIKTPERDGYAAVQLGFHEVEPRRLNRPLLPALLDVVAPDGEDRHALGRRLTPLRPGDRLPLVVGAAVANQQIQGIDLEQGIVGIAPLL